MNKATHGFTLIEIMIASFILLIVGMIISSGLNVVVKTQDRIKNKTFRLNKLQNAIMVIEADMQQVSQTPITNESNIQLPAIIVTNTSLSFTRSDFINPKEDYNSINLQRINYQIEGSRLYRTILMIVNNKILGITKKELILDKVKSFHCYLIPANNFLVKTYAQNKLNTTQSIIKTAIFFELDIEELGYVKRIIPIAINTKELDPNA